MKKKDIKNNLKDFETIARIQDTKLEYIYDSINNRFCPIVPENTLVLISVNGYDPASARLFTNNPNNYPVPICGIEFTHTKFEDIIDALIGAGFKKDNIIIEDDIILI